MPSNSRGFSLLELLVALAIIGILAAASLPMYTSYMSGSRQAATETNMGQLQIALENYYFDHNEYTAGSYGPSGTDDGTLTTTLGWKPEGDGGEFIYKVESCGAGTIKTCYTITVSRSDGKATATYTRGP